MGRPKAKNRYFTYRPPEGHHITNIQYLNYDQTPIAITNIKGIRIFFRRNEE